MYTFLVLCALLPAIGLIVLVVALANVSRTERRGQAATLIVVSLIVTAGYAFAVRSVVQS